MLVVAGLVIAFVLVLILSNRRTRSCRWRADRRQDRDGQSYYRCMACGAQVFTSNGKPPLDCAVNPRDTQED
ncbi:conserved hypothetical protein [Roseovarius sp. EC-HK134]|jgi:hypothetical protein|uniref:Uncharacterized protein n=1 Tax=Roseovarius mucosus TaxID=215743 RepID=A0A1V0RPZ5_9RHOB|nr:MULTISPECIES: hypothetical protein [Roseovarius]ARE83840.1 hypothetical protein ROSMUCSMR3_02371 [Roseovarius mucosus]AWZ19523.1 Hypothetical protein RAK1035_0812 [Roseovarius sp. AK1035]EDM33698.1 hypothetical protein RTM1035_16977 [Roseovarius sp. TM1035]MBW4974851.1 hypothetical protein [Roseovarius mucosus]VVT13611.1 conserved hypothetical protein [Roseovarius sp. EC-HK134]